MATSGHLKGIQPVTSREYLSHLRQGELSIAGPTLATWEEKDKKPANWLPSIYPRGNEQRWVSQS
jgi:hypothetical protein